MIPQCMYYAAVMKTPETRTVDGLELQLAASHLSHLLFFYLLRDLLIAGSTPSSHSRIVSVAWPPHRYSPVHFDNINFEGLLCWSIGTM